MKNFTRALALMTMTIALAFPSVAPASSSAQRHPEIHEAIIALRHAREHVTTANHDFGGHRVDALRSIDEAVHQLQTCMDYDK
jgi:hypothetical protein